MLTTSNCLNNLQYNDQHVVYNWSSIITQKVYLLYCQTHLSVPHVEFSLIVMILYIYILHLGKLHEQKSMVKHIWTYHFQISSL